MTHDRLHEGPYDYHDEYHSINTGVHRKGGVKVITPTLTHHLGLWYPPDRSQVSRLSVTRFGPRVDAYVSAHFTAMRACDDFESNFTFTVGDEEVIGLFGDAYKVRPDGSLEAVEARSALDHFGLRDAIESDNRILFMKASWHGLVVIVRCEFRSEYATITRFVTLADPTVLHPSIACFRHAAEVLLNLGQGVACSDAEIGESHKALYTSIWETLDRELFRCVDTFRPRGEGDRCQVFADFRGIVAAGCDDRATGTITLSSAVANDTPFEDDWPRTRLIPRLWPFLTVREGLDLGHREFTASFMLDRRAVYITALGPQPVARSSPQCAPLQYMLVARPVSDWQLGALVDRLHFMGTVRLAALMELKPLREAGANLRDMEHEAETARRTLDDDDTTTALNHYRRAMDLIAHKGKDGTPIFRNGLQFRVERSRYYVKRFEESVAFLGIDTIEGYQPYHHFVRARLGGVYDYIDRLGNRQERAVRSTESIFQLILLLEAAEANRQSAIANERSAEASAQSAEANRQNSMIWRTIEKLQTKAEIALLAIILPHYVIGIINDLDERLKGKQMTIFREDLSILMVGGIFASLSLFVYVLEREKFDRERLKRFALKYIVATLLSLLLVVFVVHP
ncbi:protein of unknown function [Beijerinckiaceae bacterium RH AL1]|nr:DUF3422 family protein [Beijerinckiaceae bacterium]VVB43220.1 protein of unknown function [Beijerinckiaceae bacterium RH AL8]VVB43235.1 protein of unknown function [Beijerinckiaceae bacterium RH CH11]VVC53731.1 protein of unknown function [Beijerinckiaceae bacterium RH AL1]